MTHGEMFEASYPCARELITFLFSNRINRDFLANRIRDHGLAAYEAPTPGLIVSLAQGARGAVLDVGANTGVFSLLAAAANPEAEVFAFEPLSSVREVLQANLALNPALASRIRVEPRALSRRTGAAALFEPVNDHGFLTTSSSLDSAHARNVDGGEVQEHRIETVTLDDWAAERLGDLPIKLLKVDVELHEGAVIEGARETIARHRPMIILEVLPTAELDPIARMVAEERYLDFAMAPHALRQAFRLHYHPNADNHLLCPLEQVERVFRLARQHRLGIELA